MGVSTPISHATFLHSLFFHLGSSSLSSNSLLFLLRPQREKLFLLSLQLNGDRIQQQQ
ncbi:MAG: hypothetical protein SAJ12_23415 [Jaaginema sp. PMC 1079.18]|nr:hypothetical protein [Jaaginema sp. PMC 1080.18]MEC4853942.1 hypothetical protein [Jaaginema sp. PMC 1079.18]MEC4867017.1 hypothetical protein [Jaaginema sp. PMC 1078.18]